MPAFWHWYVVVGTIVFTVWCVWLITWSAKQAPLDLSDDDLVGHKWDGDIEEWNKPAPKWWLYLYFLTIVWTVGYLIAYPGLGNYEGMLGWSQQGQYDQEMQYAAATYDPIYEEFASLDFAALTQNTEALALGQSLFASYCTTCHGSDAGGAPGYPSLKDNDWLWGDAEADLMLSIGNGRMAAMPPQGSILTAEAIDHLVEHVLSLSGRGDGNVAGQADFAMRCAMCHGPDGSGNKIFGAPNLTDDIWLYGSSEAVIRDTIVNGRNGVMPAHGDLLGENRTKILAAYVYSLSQQ